MIKQFRDNNVKQFALRSHLFSPLPHLLYINRSPTLPSLCEASHNDGFGEGLEQREIETEDGDLFVSMWNLGDDYFIYDEEEMEDHLSGENLGWYIQ